MDQSAPVYEEFKSFGSSVTILIKLLDGPMMASDVKKITEYRTGLSKLRQYAGIGLVKMSIDPSWRKTNWYELTPKGRKVALLLKEAQDIIDQT